MKSTSCATSADIAAARDDRDLHALQARVWGEFREVSGIMLTLPQAARLFSLDARHCEGVLRRLVEHGELVTGGRASLALMRARAVRKENCPSRACANTPLRHADRPRRLNRQAQVPGVEREAEDAASRVLGAEMLGGPYTQRSATRVATGPWPGSTRW